MQLASCNPSAAKNFMMAPKVLENMCTHSLENVFQNLSAFTFTDLTSFREVNVLETNEVVLIHETLSSFNFNFCCYVLWHLFQFPARQLLNSELKRTPKSKKG
jgi:hypothetical protein